MMLCVKKKNVDNKKKGHGSAVGTNRVDPDIATGNMKNCKVSV